MVQFEEMIKALELREVLIRFLEQKAHPWLNQNIGLDMDQFQANVFRNLPQFTFKNGLLTCVASGIFWQIHLVMLHFLVQLILRTFKGLLTSNENVLKMSSKDQWYYSSYYHCSIHAVFAVLSALFGLLYADGQYGTTWFHCNYYKLHMFDSQKYLSMISMGFYIQNFIFCINSTNFKNDGAYKMQVLFHHVIVIFGNLLALWLGGFFGSCSQISFILEASTPFVSMRQILAYHNSEKAFLYKINSIVMTFAFFIFRVCFFYYMVFWKCQDFMMYRFVSFQQTYPQYKWKWCKFCFIMYFMVYMLNLYWFSKMLWGLMEGLGIDQAIRDTERILDEEDDSSDNEDEKLKQD